MKITIAIESPSIGEIVLESPLYAEEAGQNIRATAAAVLVDVLVPRALGALQIQRAVPETELDRLAQEAAADPAPVPASDHAGAEE